MGWCVQYKGQKCERICIVTLGCKCAKSEATPTPSSAPYNTLGK